MRQHHDSHQAALNIRRQLGPSRRPLPACMRLPRRHSIVPLLKTQLALRPCSGISDHRDGRVPRSAQREAARASWLSERQHVAQARFAGSGAFGDQPRRSQCRAANGVLHCSRQHAPPPDVRCCSTAVLNMRYANGKHVAMTRAFTLEHQLSFLCRYRMPLRAAPTPPRLPLGRPTPSTHRSSPGTPCPTSLVQQLATEEGRALPGAQDAVALNRGC